MDQKKILILTISALVIALSAGAWYRLEQGKNAPTPAETAAAAAEENGLTPPPESAEGLVSGTEADSAVVEENRSVDIDAALDEIMQSAESEDAFMEYEASGEEADFAEGAVLMENLGKSYDENTY